MLVKGATGMDDDTGMESIQFLSIEAFVMIVLFIIIQAS